MTSVRIQCAEVSTAIDAFEHKTSEYFGNFCSCLQEPVAVMTWIFIRQARNSLDLAERDIFQEENILTALQMLRNGQREFEARQQLFTSIENLARVHAVHCEVRDRTG